MLIDLANPSSLDNTKNYDYCICGGGVAGITAALKLADSGVTVALLEAGSLEYSQQSQDLYKCDSISKSLWPESTRLRFFGGTSNHWAGRCRPFEDTDFEQRSYFQLPGWPIPKSDMDIYLPEAKEILDLQGIANIETGTINLKENFEPDKFQLSKPTRFKEKYLQSIINNKSIDLIINANVTSINAEKSGQIDSVHIQNYDGFKNSISAGRFIIAMGGIENARILLLSDDQQADGLGNQSDYVGRCFMEHLNVNFGTFIANPDVWQNTHSMQYFASRDFINKENIGGANVTLNIVKDIEAYGRTRKIKEFLQQLTCQIGFEDSIQHWVRFNCPGEGAIGTLLEQQANPDSRVFLSKTLDSLGLRKLIIDWRLSTADKKTIRTIAKEAGKQMAKSNIGRMKLHDFVFDESLGIPAFHHSHHMGTTRMAAAPEDGVTDINCKVFGTSNLYLAGSSLFPTGGAANPTMPLLQLTLRLIDHLA
jgi:choline dehydrogenase-like flavoprotein